MLAMAVRSSIEYRAIVTFSTDSDSRYTSGSNISRTTLYGLKAPVLSRRAGGPVVRLNDQAIADRRRSGRRS